MKNYDRCYDVIIFGSDKTINEQLEIPFKCSSSSRWHSPCEHDDCSITVEFPWLVSVRVDNCGFNFVQPYAKDQLLPAATSYMYMYTKSKCQMLFHQINKFLT